MVKVPAEWSEEDRLKVVRALKEHRLNRVDLYVWQQAEISNRSAHDLGLEFLMTASEMKRRVESAGERLKSTLERPFQEAYLGRWLNT